MSLLPAPTKLLQSNGSLQHAAAGAAIRVHARDLRQFDAKRRRSILHTDDPTIKDGPRFVGAGALWSGINKNRDVSTEPLARPFARSLAPLTRSLAPDCSLCCAHSFAHSLTSLTPSLRSLPRSWESEFLMSQNDLVLSHSAPVLPYKRQPQPSVSFLAYRVEARLTYG